MPTTENRRLISRRSARKRYWQDPVRFRSIAAEWKTTNPEKVAEVKRRWYGKNRVDVRSYNQNYFQKNKDQINARRRQRRLDDPQFALRCILSVRLNEALRTTGAQKNSSALTYLGCSLEQLKLHIEAKFLPGMTWENRGSGATRWHVDHIKPLKSFDLTDETQLKMACHYTNLQPLWQPLNQSKGAK